MPSWGEAAHDVSIAGAVLVVLFEVLRAVRSLGPAAALRALLPATLVVTVAAVVNAAGRTGGPWCDPDSILQWHGVWHLGAAAALVLVGRVGSRADTTLG